MSINNRRTEQTPKNQNGFLRLFGSLDLQTIITFIFMLVGGAFGYYKFILERSVPANIQLSLDTTVIPPDKADKTKLDLATELDDTKMIPISFTIKANNDSNFRDLTLHRNLWFAFGWKYIPKSEAERSAKARIYDLHRLAELLYGNPVLYEKHLEMDKMMNPAEKIEEINKLNNWISHKGETPLERYDDATKRRLAEYNYLRELIGVGDAFSKGDLTPGQKIEVTHVIPVPVNKKYQAIEIRILLPTSEPGRRADFFGLWGYTNEILKVDPILFEFQDRGKISSPSMLPQLCPTNQCEILNKQQQRNLRYQSQVITSQIWLPKQ